MKRFALIILFVAGPAFAQQTSLTPREQYEQNTIINYHNSVGRLLDENAKLQKDLAAAQARVKELEAAKDAKP